MCVEREEGSFMPWNDKNDGGGPWKPSDKNNGPWGQGPQGPKGGGSGGTPPDLEEILRRGQERLKQALPGGGGGSAANPVFFGLLGAGALALWLMQAVYQVQPDQLGQELFLGKPKAEVSMPGLHFHFWPLEKVEIVSTTQQREQIGSSNAATSSGRKEGQMLSGDQNVVDVNFTVIWSVNDPKKYLFGVTSQREMVRMIAESAMREFVGRSNAEEVRTEGRQKVEDAVRTQTQLTLDSYEAGVTVVGVQLEKADPPLEVASAFEEVQRAQQNQDQVQREADAYANKRLGEARGEASRMREEAQGYKQSIVAEAQGQAARFVSVYDEYAKAKDVTRERLYLETIEQVFSRSRKIIMEPGGQGVVPYLPLSELPAPNKPKTEVAN
jgi:modulator of FtsH protease HflK